MVWVFDEFLDIDPGITKSLFRFRPRSVIAFYERNVIMRHAHSPASAAGDGLYHDRIANPFSHRQGILLVVHNPIGPGWTGNPGFLGERAADRFILQRVHRAGIS